MKHKILSSEEEAVIVNRATEKPFSGKYNDFKDDGIFVCKRCELSLFRSKDKFDSKTGWPSFDEAIDNSVDELQDENRTEVVCKKCKAHLGHVFRGEHFTDKNTRYCINSIALDFVRQKGEFCYFAGGCFWGLDYFFNSLEGVLSTTCGYSGGDTKKPSYEEVCYEQTGHFEVLQIEYNPKQTSFEKLARYFFEIHDPTQADGQGNDIGHQYKSAIFYTSQEQKKTSEYLIGILKKSGHDIQTKLIEFMQFYPAEPYHQDYYKKNKKLPYCHHYTPRFSA